MSIDKAYTFICRLSNTKRFVGRHLHTPYSVADHTLRVIYLTAQICHHYKKNESDTIKELYSAMMHDFDEAFTGDIPAPYKRILDIKKYKINVIMKENGVILEDHIMRNKDNHSDIVKLADMLECFITCSYELERGNKSLLRCFNELNEKLQYEIQRMKLYDSIIGELYLKAKKDANI